jgi:hypothetical protein
VVNRIQWERSGPWIATSGMVANLFLYGISGTVAPWWAVVLLMLVWLFLMGLTLAWFTRRPLAVMVLPVVAFVVWFAAITTGGAVLGWTSS